MSRYIHHYKTASDFKKDYYSEDKYKSPWTSYVDRKGRWEAYPVNYNRQGGPILPPPPYVWVDDFPDGTDEGYSTPYDPEYVEEKYGDSGDFDDYLYDYFDDLIGAGSNKFEYVDEMEYGGIEYFLYQLMDSEGTDVVLYGLMPKEYSTSGFLSERAMETDNDNRFFPFHYILQPDETLYMNLIDKHP